EVAEEARGQRPERRLAQPVRPLAPVAQRPEADQERGRAGPDAAIVGDDDQLLAEPRDGAEPAPRLGGRAAEEDQRNEGRLPLEDGAEPLAQRAGRVVEHGEAHGQAGSFMLGATGGGSSATSARRRMRWKRYRFAKCIAASDSSSAPSFDARVSIAG